MVTAATKLRCLLFGREAMTNLDSVLKKQKCHFANKSLYGQNYGFSSTVPMWAPKNWCFQTVVLEKTLESPLDCKINQSILKEIDLEYSLEGLMLELRLQYLGHLMRRANTLEKTLMLGKIEGKRRKGWQRMWWLHSITNSTEMNFSKLQEIEEDR